MSPTGSGCLWHELILLAADAPPVVMDARIAEAARARNSSPYSSAIAGVVRRSRCLALNAAVEVRKLEIAVSEAQRAPCRGIVRE